jgi:hypothetical protein
MRELRDRFPRLLQRHALTVALPAIGAVAGLGLFGIVLGGVIGYLGDEVRVRLAGNRTIDRFLATGSVEGLDRRTVTLASVTALAGYVLSASTVREGRTRVDRELMKRRIAESFRLGGAERELVDEYAERALESDDLAVSKICRSLRNASAGIDELEAVVVLLYRVAPGESGTIEAGHDSLIRSIAAELGIDPTRFVQLRKPFLPKDTEAYRILGIDPEAETDEIKRTFRRLASQFHPDASGELDPEQIEQTGEAFIRIRSAYQRVMSERSAETGGHDSI